MSVLDDTPNAARRDGVLWLQGEHDRSTVDELAFDLAWAMADADGAVVVDLGGVAFMDAATVGVLIGAGRFLAARGGVLSLRSPSPCARRVLDLAGVAYADDSRGSALSLA